MGRRAIPIELIDEVRKRQTTFNKRKLGLLKKAIELSILCDVEISVVMFSKHNGEPKMHQYSSSDPRLMLERALMFSGPLESFTNASFPHASTAGSSANRAEKRRREDDFPVNPVSLMTHLLNSSSDHLMSNESASIPKVCRPRIDPLAQAYQDSLDKRSLPHQHSMPIDDHASHHNSHADSHASHQRSHEQNTEVLGGGTWECSGGDVHGMGPNVEPSLPLASSSVAVKPTPTLPPLPSPIRKSDPFGRKPKLWRRELNVQIPHSNIRSTSELSARLFRTPKLSGDQHHTFPNSFENHHGIPDVPLDPLATPKTPFAMSSPGVMNPSRLVASESVVSPIATTFPPSVAI